MLFLNRKDSIYIEHRISISLHITCDMLSVKISSVGNLVVKEQMFIYQVEVIKNVEHFDTSDDVSPTALQTRTDAFDAAFKNVEKKAAKRETNLLNAIKFFNFKSQCDRCKFWLSERQRDLLSIKSTNENR